MVLLSIPIQGKAVAAKKVKVNFNYILRNEVKKNDLLTTEMLDSYFKM